MNPKQRSLLVAASLAAILVCGPGATSAQLANPGFDEGPLGLVGSVQAIVWPVFQAGIWGAELAYIAGSSGDLQPLSAPYMLEMISTGQDMSDTQALQVIHAPFPFDYVELKAWANCQAPATFGLKIHFFADPDGWPDALATHLEYFTLDASPLTWEPFGLEPQARPAGTQWIVAEVNFLNETLDEHAGCVDDVELIFHGAVSADAASWSSVKGLFR
jgi:hypothetical protein